MFSKHVVVIKQYDAAVTYDKRTGDVFRIRLDQLDLLDRRGTAAEDDAIFDERAQLLEALAALGLLEETGC
jgi:hypothetical protein